MARTRSLQPRYFRSSKSQKELDKEASEKHNLPASVSVLSHAFGLDLTHRDARKLFPEDLIEHSVHVGMVRNMKLVEETVRAIQPVKLLKFSETWDNHTTPDIVLEVLDFVRREKIEVEALELSGDFEERLDEIVEELQRVEGCYELILSNYKHYGMQAVGGETKLPQKILELLIAKERVGSFRRLNLGFSWPRETQAEDWRLLERFLLSSNPQITSLKLPKSMHLKLPRGFRSPEPWTTPFLRSIINQLEHNYVIMELDKERREGGSKEDDEIRAQVEVWLARNRAGHKRMLDAVYEMLAIKKFRSSFFWIPKDVVQNICLYVFSTRGDELWLEN